MSHRKTISALASVASAALLAGTAMVAAPANAVPTPGTTSGMKYVALGSSYAAGAGVGPHDPADAGGVCGRTTVAYPYLVAKALDLALTNSTCGGATIQNIATTKQHVVYPSQATVGLQIDAVGADTDLVTITIGGNDVNYVGNLLAEACLGDLAANPASLIGNGLKAYGICVPRPDDVVMSELAQLQTKLSTMVQTVQAKAPHARILLVDYPTVLPENGEPCAVAPIPKDRQKFLLQVARELSLATKHAAQATGAEFVAASKESRHHDVCSSDPWMTGYDFRPGTAAMHPTPSGHAAVADAVIRQLTKPGSAT